jgi:hypothetical protein
MKEGINHMLCIIKKELVLFLSIGFGMVLFILIFKPFPLDQIDFDNRKIFIIGMGAIIFLIIILVRVVLPNFKFYSSSGENDLKFPSYLRSFLIWSLSFIAFLCFLHFFGAIVLSSYIIFKVALICLAPPAILDIYDKNASMKLDNALLNLQLEIVQKKNDTSEKENLNQSIEFHTEKTSEKFSLLNSEILFFKSADNYVEIYYRKGGEVNKKVIRSKLRDVEFHLRIYPNLIRCHRSYIVNIHHIEKASLYNTHHELILFGVKEPIPVSRQHCLKMKESL